jgi:hypothetical protein
VENQSIEWDAEELITLPFAVRADQYPNGTVFAWKFQVVLDGAEVFATTGTATVAGLSFDVPLTTTQTNQAVEQYEFSLKDTTNSRTLAKGTLTVNAGQV